MNTENTKNKVGRPRQSFNKVITCYRDSAGNLQMRSKGKPNSKIAYEQHTVAWNWKRGDAIAENAVVAAAQTETAPVENVAEPVVA